MSLRNFARDVISQLRIMLACEDISSNGSNVHQRTVRRSRQHMAGRLSTGNGACLQRGIWEPCELGIQRRRRTREVIDQGIKIETKSCEKVLFTYEESHGRRQTKSVKQLAAGDSWQACAANNNCFPRQVSGYQKNWSPKAQETTRVKSHRATDK